ncbi:MAG: hypothetical protein KDK36_06735, partial [Leptospiraceae bacterium]|nr:hypothetical protein [Leptospiraceae bacterium]
MKKLILKLLITSLPFLFVNCPGKSSGADSTSLLLPLLLSGSSSGSGSSGGSGSSYSGYSGSSSSSYSTVYFTTGSASKSSPISGETINFPVTVNAGSSNTGDYTLDLYLSTDSNITVSDTKIGSISVNNQTTNQQTLSIAIPSNLVGETAQKPVRYYYGFINGENSKSSYSYITVYPYKSLVKTLTMGSTVSDSFTSDVNQIFYEFGMLSGTTKFTLSTFKISGGLDLAITAYQYNNSSYSIVGSEINSNSTNSSESSSYTLSGGPLYYTGTLRVRKVSGTTGNFTVSGMGNKSYYVPFTSSKPSCIGGTGNFANRCVTYLDGDPLNSATCVALQGAGSTYSSSPCSSTNVIRKCYVNPFLEDTRGVVYFYSGTGDVTSADNVCGGH